MKKLFASLRHSAALCGLFALCLALSACATTGDPKETDSGPKAAAQPAQSGLSLSLVHGVRTTLPEGWVVNASMDAGSKSGAEIEQLLKGDKPVQILSAHRVDSTGQSATGRVVFALVDATKSFIPQQDAATLPPQEFAKYAKAVLDREKQLAAKAKTEGGVLEYSLERQTISGKLALVHKILSKRPGGVIRAYDLNLYLPGGKGLIVRTMGFQEYPNNDAELMGILRSTSVTP